MKLSIRNLINRSPLRRGLFLAPLSLASALVLSTLITLVPSTTRATTIALSITGGIYSGNEDTTSGWGFSLSSPILLTDVGVWDDQNDGLGSPHVVTVWTSTGTQLVQATVPDGASAT